MYCDRKVDYTTIFWISQQLLSQMNFIKKILQPGKVDCQLHLIYQHIEDMILIINRVLGDVGKAGVAIDSIQDMEISI